MTDTKMCTIGIDSTTTVADTADPIGSKKESFEITPLAYQNKKVRLVIQHTERQTPGMRFRP